jgi:hypothetical protein
MNNDKLEVPRHLPAELVDQVYMDWSGRSESLWPDLIDAIERAGLVTAVAPSAQRLGETSAEQCEAGCQAYMKADGKGGPFVMHPSSMGYAYKAMRVLERTVPVAVVLPERSNERDHAGDWTYEAKAWNACLDEVTRLNTK